MSDSQATTDKQGNAEGNHQQTEVSRSSSSYEVILDGGRTPTEGVASRRRRLLKQTSKVFMASLGMWTLGTTFVYPSVLAGDLSRHNTTIYGDYISFTDQEIDMSGSFINLGCVVGAWLIAAAIVYLGRHTCMVISAIVILLSWVGVALSPNVTGILISRLLSGVGDGGLTVTVNAYGVELADDDVRGFMAMIVNLGIYGGQVICVGVGYSARYYVVALVLAAVPAVFLVCLAFLPESPSALVLKGRENDAQKVLIDLRGKHVNMKDEIQKYLDMNREASSHSVMKGLLYPEIYKPIIVVSILFILMYFTGYLVVSANASRIFQDAGSSIDDRLATIIINVVQFVSAFLGSLVMDRLGRRTLLMLSFGLMCVPLAILAIYVGVTGEDDKGDFGWVPLVCLMVSQAAVVIGVNPLPFILSNEYFPTWIRPQASSICFTVGMVAGFGALQLYTPMREGLTQMGLYVFYSSVCAIGIPFTYFFVHETKGIHIG